MDIDSDQEFDTDLEDDQDDKVPCGCGCKQILSRSQVYRHERRGAGPSHLRGVRSLQESELDELEPQPSSKRRKTVDENRKNVAGKKTQKTRKDSVRKNSADAVRSPALPKPPSPPPDNAFQKQDYDGDAAHSPFAQSPPRSRSGSPSRSVSPLGNVARWSLAGALRHQQLFDSDDESDASDRFDFLDEEQDGNEDGMDGMDEGLDEDREWEPEMEGLTTEERMDEYWLQDVAEYGMKPTDADMLAIRAFNFKVITNITQVAFNALPFAFPGLRLPSVAELRKRITFLSALQPVLYDCCRNSCMAYTGDFADLEACSYCHQPRRGDDGRPVKRYSYLPLIPRLRAMWADPELAQVLRYRTEFKHEPGTIRDVYDAERYRSLCDEYVEIEGKRCRHKYFGAIRDMALALSFDGFSVFKKRTHTCWPTILINLSLPPELRHHLDKILSIGVIPGPQQMKDSDSFHYPLLEELLQLAAGVAAWDGWTKELFTLHAFLLHLFGDIPAIAKLMRMKGHNALSPCRACSILGIQIPESANHTHYVPHDRRRFPHAPGTPPIPSYTPTDLPMRTHQGMLAQARAVESADSKAASGRLAKEYGIKGESLWFHAPGMCFPECFPYDFMHLIFENLMPNLIDLWTGNFKSLDEGTGSYQLPDHVVREIADAAVAAGNTIPSAYGCRIPHLVDKRSEFTAEAWMVFTLFLAPTLFEGRWIGESKAYYDHFLLLVRLITLCLKFEYTRDDVQEIRSGFERWVLEYERLYYQYEPARASTCPLTIHALLHIADGIEKVGPVWAHWAFPMERYCGFLGHTSLNRKNPYPSLDRRSREVGQLQHMKCLYHLTDELSLKPPAKPDSAPYPNYPKVALLRPSSTVTLSQVLRGKIASHLAVRYSRPVASTRSLVPKELTQWGKLRILDGGDTIHTLNGIKNNSSTRDMTFVRYEQVVGPRSQATVLYGQLLHILVLPLARGTCLKLKSEETLLLGVLAPCDNLRRPSSASPTPKYNGLSGMEVVDLQTIQNVVGRIHDRAQRWSIVDRNDDLVRPEFLVEADDGDQDDDDDAL